MSDKRPPDPSETMTAAEWIEKQPVKDVNEAVSICGSKWFSMSDEEKQSFLQNRMMYFHDMGTARVIPEMREKARQAFEGKVIDMNPPTPTGFPLFDDILNGGLWDRLYVLGAVSSLGKTTFVLQIADHIAEADTNDVMIFSLEMSREELLSKTLSRYTAEASPYNDTRDAKTSSQIINRFEYRNYNTTARSLIEKAMSRLEQHAHRLFIIEGVGNIDAEDVREAVRRHKAMTGRAPVVIIDYLQLLAPHRDLRKTTGDIRANIDKNIMELKRLSRDEKTPVIAISSLNRVNYKNAIDLEAFKESGAIEYTSDVVVGLQFEGAGQEGFSVTAKKKEKLRKVELVVLKNRHGASGGVLRYDYQCLFNAFTERGIKPDDEPRGQEATAQPQPMKHTTARRRGRNRRDLGEDDDE